MSDRIALIRRCEDLEAQLADLRRRYADLSNEVVRLRRESSDASWITNPDRQGGAFTQDEIDNTGWK